ncbi:MAG: DEAD/DEAH box helicase, partial [Chloroflexota bacterium]
NQTASMAQEYLGQIIRYVRDPQKTGLSDIIITNYENAHKFDPADFGAVVLDESSILKSLDSTMRLQLTAQWKGTPYRLCCTATPAPNDLKEIVNHADFLGVMTRKETFASFFINEQGKNGSLNTRLKRHAVKPFYRWLASWAVAMRKPSDLGYSDDGFTLPSLTVTPHIIKSDYQPEGRLFVTKLGGVTERAAVRRETEPTRIAKAADLARDYDPDQIIIWHQTNAEGHALVKALGDAAVLVEGAQSAEEKEYRFRQFITGEKRILITKPRIAGFGMNFQQSHRAIVMSLNDSYEEFYQLVRRQYRYGQAQSVTVDVIYADVQQSVWENVQRKAAEAEQLSANLVEHMNVHQQQIRQPENRQTGEDYQVGEASGNNWRLLLGDSCERMAELDPDSVGLSVHSPPFVNRYAYTATERDLGNSNGIDQFMQHYRHIIRELYRVTMPGRNACVHLQQVRLTKRDTGAVQLLDFKGPVIEAFKAEGWTLYHEVTVDKDAQAQAKRKHHVALMF